MDPEIADRCIKFLNTEYHIVFDLLNIKLDFNEYRYFVSHNALVLFEIHTDNYIEYDIYSDRGVIKNRDFFEDYQYLIETGQVFELSEDEWLILNIK